MVDDCGKLGLAARQVHVRQLALKDGVLQVVAKITHGVVDGAQSLLVADVVTDQIGGAHSYNGSPCSEEFGSYEGTNNPIPKWAECPRHRGPETRRGKDIRNAPA